MRVHRLVGLAVAAGCASTSGERPAPAESAATAPAHEHGMGAMAMCPMQVPGTTATTADVEGGVALSFTTSTDVADGRQRVRRMAEMHNQHHSGGMMMGPQGAGSAPGEHEHERGACCGGERVSGGMMMVPAATASVEDVQGGARLVLRPRDPAQLEALREHVRMHAARMAQGECPMMAPPPSGDGGHEAHHPLE